LIALVVGAVAGTSFASTATITRARARTVAKAINLRRSDLPTFSQHPNPITQQDERNTAAYVACYGGVPPGDALTVQASPNFASPGSVSATFFSEVEILPSAALVAKDLAAATTQRGVSCLNAQIAGGFSTGLPKSETLTVHSSLSRSLGSGGVRTFAIRTSVSFHAKRGATDADAPVYIDELGFATGQLEVFLSADETGTTPSRSLEQRLLSILILRAAAAAG
jgi:hypothetical protein